jgi:hypothetical protein
MYFCPQLLGAKRRTKENVQTTPNLWADIDSADPTKLSVAPSVVVESSPERYQGYWILEEPIDPELAEDGSRRIAYYHKDDGVDKSGWDLTQLLRVPFTHNFKYKPAAAVKVVTATNNTYVLRDFEGYPPAKGFEYLEVPLPDVSDLDADALLQKNRTEINPRAWTLYYEAPKDDWSKALWQLELLLFESGFSREEVFVVVQQSACNKYRRDDRDVRLLWKEVCRAQVYLKTESVRKPETDAVSMGSILTDAERQWVVDNPSIVEEYVEWAKTLGDAAWQYHQAGAFVALSALTAARVRLPTSYGILIPNLWFMILADTTLTRKTTAMDIAMDMIMEIDPDCMLATDGSIEGLFTSLGGRPGRASIFLRDEFSGLLEAMTKKEYMAGMSETLTKLYDGKYQKRVLRREIIEVRDPVLILFAGGIRTRIHELLRIEHVSSGFIPRFIFIGAESDITKLRALGPPTDDNILAKEKLKDGFREIYNHYHQEVAVTHADKTSLVQKRWDATLEEEAWVRYNTYEADLVSVGLESNMADILTPTFDRMAKSGLKMAVLLAAARQRNESLLVEEGDVIRAFYYIEQWAQHTLNLIANIGKNANERQLDKVLGTIKRRPGVSRSVLMQNHHLTSRDATLVFETLEQRGQVVKEKRGRGEFFTSAE